MSKNKSSNYNTLARGVDQQIKSGDPREVKDAYKRLLKAGYDDEAIRDMCVWVMATEYFRMLVYRKAFDLNQYASDFKRLPVMPWDADPDITQEEVREAVFENPDLIIETTEETLDRYKRIRPKMMEIHEEMLDYADKLILFKSAEALGLISGDVITVDSEDTLTILWDYFIYADLKHRRKIVKAYRKRHGKSLDADQEELLDAILHAQYSLLLCKETIPGLGIQVHDVIHNEVFRLIDINLSKSIKPGITLASYVITPYGLHMTTGAALPVINKAVMNDINKAVERIAQDETLSYEADQKELVTAVIRTLLQHETMDHVRFR